MLKLTALSLVLAALAFSGARAGYVIKGQVRDERGEAACGVRVCAIVEGFDRNRPHAPIPCALTDARGQFAVNVEKPGKYALYYDHSEGGYYSPYVPFFHNPSSPAPEVVLDEAGVTAPVNVSMPPKNGILSGRGVDAETGLPVDNLNFVLCHADAPNVCWGKSARHPKGEFKVPAAYVPFTVRVSAEGYEDWFGPDGADGRAPLSVAPATTWELNVRLKRSAASAGRALDESEKQEGVNLPAPAQTAPAEGAVFNHYPRRTRLEWAPVEGAVSYRVEVDFCSGRRKDAKGCADPQPLAMTSNPPTSGIRGTSYEFDFVGMQPGRWRVWAVDASGREGFKSPWRGFVYLQ
jgi:hypothetical protein